METKHYLKKEKNLTKQNSVLPTWLKQSKILYANKESWTLLSV